MKPIVIAAALGFNPRGGERLVCFQPVAQSALPPEAVFQYEIRDLVVLFIFIRMCAV